MLMLGVLVFWIEMPAVLRLIWLRTLRLIWFGLVVVVVKVVVMVV